MLSPVMGRLAAEWILDGLPLCVPDAAALSPARFAGPVR
jgi:glycine/D-amino acid oxidase-like deaminating enzyme